MAYKARLCFHPRLDNGLALVCRCLLAVSSSGCVTPPIPSAWLEQRPTHGTVLVQKPRVLLALLATAHLQHLMVLHLIRYSRARTLCPRRDPGGGLNNDCASIAVGDAARSQSISTLANHLRGLQWRIRASSARCNHRRAWQR